MVILSKELIHVIPFPPKINIGSKNKYTGLPPNWTGYYNLAKRVALGLKDPFATNSLMLFR